MTQNVICGFVPCDKIKINKNELAVRLMVKRDYTHFMVDEVLEAFYNAVSYRYAYFYTDIKLPGEGICDLGFCTLKSMSLYKNLYGLKRAVIMGVTTGFGIDRLIKGYGVTSPAKQFLIDAAGSAGAEALCDYMDKLIRGEGKKTPRFSPGYGDLSLDTQDVILKSLDAQRTLGITLNTGLLMSPEKSVTAIMGVNNE